MKTGADAFRTRKLVILAGALILAAGCAGIIIWALLANQQAVEVAQDIRIDGTRPAHTWDAAASGQRVTWSNSLEVKVTASYEEISPAGDLSGPVGSYLITDAVANKVGTFPADWTATDLTFTVQAGNEITRQNLPLPDDSRSVEVQFVTWIADDAETVNIQIETGFVVDELEATLRWRIPGPNGPGMVATPLPEAAKLTVRFRDDFGAPIAGGCIRVSNAIIQIERCDNGPEDPNAEIGAIEFDLPQGFSYLIQETRAPIGFAQLTMTQDVADFSPDGAEVVLIHRR